MRKFFGALILTLSACGAPIEEEAVVSDDSEASSTEQHMCSVRCRDGWLFMQGVMTRAACHQQYPVCERHGKVCRIKWGDVYITVNSGC